MSMPMPSKAPGLASHAWRIPRGTTLTCRERVSLPTAIYFLSAACPGAPACSPLGVGPVAGSRPGQMQLDHCLGLSGMLGSTVHQLWVPTGSFWLGHSVLNVIFMIPNHRAVPSAPDVGFAIISLTVFMSYLDLWNQKLRGCVITALGA